MKNMIYIQCPTELLVSLQVNSEKFAEMVKLQTAIALFKQGKISSGMAAKWLEIPRFSYPSNGRRCRIARRFAR